MREAGVTPSFRQAASCAPRWLRHAKACTSRCEPQFSAPSGIRPRSNKGLGKARVGTVGASWVRSSGSRFQWARPRVPTSAIG